ncbi:MAG: putative membrane protein [Myxococcota bacterium]|jgi:uncharacterized membrane protein
MPRGTIRGMPSRVFAELRLALIAGVLVLAPLGVTSWVFFALVSRADSVIELLPHRLQPETLLGFHIPGLGILLSLMLVVGVGLAMQYYTGRRVVELFEGLLGRVPVLSGIYQGVKQLIDTIFSRKGAHFREVVLVEYPRRGLYCLAFLTNEDSWLKIPGVDSELISIFLPTTPNPTSGFYLLVSREDVKRLDLTPEEAFKVIMSAGIVTPGVVGLSSPTPDAPAPPAPPETHTDPSPG